MAFRARRIIERSTSIDTSIITNFAIPASEQHSIQTFRFSDQVSLPGRSASKRWTISCQVASPPTKEKRLDERTALGAAAPTYVRPHSKLAGSLVIVSLYWWPRASWELSHHAS